LEEKVCKRISIILSKTTILMKFYNLKKNKKTVFAKNRMCVRERERKKDKTWDGTKVNIPRKLHQVNHYVNDRSK
jgi:hypothetical protein